MAKTFQVGSPRRSVRALSELTGLPAAQCSSLAEAIYARKLWLKRLPPIAATAAFLGWMVVFGRGTDALEGTNWDILAFLRDSVGFAGVLLLMFGVGITMALLVGVLIPRAIMRRQFVYHLCSPACFWCGYSLQGLKSQHSTIQCPECGQPSPVRE